MRVVATGQAMDATVASTPTPASGPEKKQDALQELNIPDWSWSQTWDQENDQHGSSTENEFASGKALEKQTLHAALWETWYRETTVARLGQVLLMRVLRGVNSFCGSNGVRSDFFFRILEEQLNRPKPFLKSARGILFIDEA